MFCFQTSISLFRHLRHLHHPPTPVPRVHDLLTVPSRCSHLRDLRFRPACGCLRFVFSSRLALFTRLELIFSSLRLSFHRRRSPPLRSHSIPTLRLLGHPQWPRRQALRASSRWSRRRRRGGGGRRSGNLGVERGNSRDQGRCSSSFGSIVGGKGQDLVVSLFTSLFIFPYASSPFVRVD